MTLRKPLTLTQDETQVPFSILSGTGPRHPAKIVIHSPNRSRSEASFHAASGSTCDDTETSTRAKVFLPWRSITPDASGAGDKRTTVAEYPDSLARIRDPGPSSGKVA